MESGGAEMSLAAGEAYSLKVSRGVVEAIIRLAALDVPGVVGLGHPRRLVRLPGARNAGSGVQLEVRDGTASIELHLVLARTAAMRDVCSQVQCAVLVAVRDQVGMPVEKVNVVVQDVR